VVEVHAAAVALEPRAQQRTEVGQISGPKRIDGRQSV
jgi:hypothetical protein